MQVVTPDPAQRVASEGVEVAAGAPIVLLHPATQQALHCDPACRQRVPNDFGFEFEVSGKAVVSTSLNQARDASCLSTDCAYCPAHFAPCAVLIDCSVRLFAVSAGACTDKAWQISLAPSRWNLARHRRL